MKLEIKNIYFLNMTKKIDITTVREVTRKHSRIFVGGSENNHYLALDSQSVDIPSLGQYVL